ncbi:MAG: polyhydroxyalkanoate synthesis repressor PhaR [Roseovarius sp.]|nr:polyhydroxyalkanoate synthesis repressor PhaR [Roseovarius sp.]MCY4207631.1 polyhydroxyalkanoate synthesis repressor PhaR [Roseovarius sp.]MCY4291702.1 polyhydroxyalkanoate synthesis repressor PhaR [Roseovarius sp.]
MEKSQSPLLIKRYASRRLYNSETSDYVTLEDIAAFIRNGREVQITDLKTGDDLTCQYLLQIIVEHESKGEKILPANILNELVRSYTTQATSLVPDFLSMSFEMLQKGQNQIMENMAKANPLAAMPGMEALRMQQEAFLNTLTLNSRDNAKDRAKDSDSRNEENESELGQIKKQLAELQDQLSKLTE